MNSYSIKYTDMVSGDDYWSCWVKSDLVPNIKDFVVLPSGKEGRVLFIKHVYEKNKDEFNVLSHIEVVLEWV